MVIALYQPVIAYCAEQFGLSFDEGDIGDIITSLTRDLARPDINSAAIKYNEGCKATLPPAGRQLMRLEPDEVGCALLLAAMLTVETLDNALSFTRFCYPLAELEERFLVFLTCTMKPPLAA